VSLEGDGSRGFSTPLATLHAFNGFADLFLSTPATGLTDLYVKASAPLGDNFSAAVTYHKLESELGSITLGDEFDFVAEWSINKNLKATAKFASFNGETSPNVNKLWDQLDMKY
jgi:hypothetical protein